MIYSGLNKLYGSIQDLKVDFQSSVAETEPTINAQRKKLVDFSTWCDYGGSGNSA